MYTVLKRSGEVVPFQIERIINAIKKAFEATKVPYTDNVLEFIALKVTADFAPKVRNDIIEVESIQDSV